MSEIPTNIRLAKFLPALEAFLSLAIEILGLVFVFLLFRYVGEWITNDNFAPDILLSLVVLPAIYLLKDIIEVAEPYFVKVELKEGEVVVETGVFTRSKDSLKLKNVENIEVITTILGRRFNYGTLNLYAYGSWVQIPNITNYEKYHETIEAHIKKSESKA